MKTKKTINIGIIGCGVVGCNVIKILQKHSTAIRRKTGCPLKIKWICDQNPDTIKNLDLPNVRVASDYRQIVSDPEVHIIVELIGGTGAARSLISEAMNCGKHIVTANKALLAAEWNKIFSLAMKKHVQVYFEAAVGAGIPVLQSLNEGLAANSIRSITGILNGTTNFILSKMDNENMTFEQALSVAQELGFAEADPTLDINGSDAVQKLSILASLAFGRHLPVSKIHREGITGIKLQDIKYAHEKFGYVLKLLATVTRQRNRVFAAVHPAFISSDHPLASVEDEYNAVLINGDSAGDVMLYGKGAGGPAAASAVVSDIIYLARNVFYGIAGSFPYVVYETDAEIPVVPLDDIRFKYYIRFSTIDRPGVLSTISGILGKYNVSISACFQEERRPKHAVPILMLTHQANEGDLRKAIAEIDRLTLVRANTVVMRIAEA